MAPTSGVAMQLLPIIIVVSLLGFFILLTLLALAIHCLRSHQSRRAMVTRIESRRPTKQMTIQSGKVISINKSCETSTANFLSQDVESLRSETQTPSGEKELQIPRSVLLRQSGSSNHNAQRANYEKRQVSEEALQELSQQLRLSSKSTDSRGMFAQERASIATSLKKAYGGSTAHKIESTGLPEGSEIDIEHVSPSTKSRRVSSAPVNGRTSRISTRSFRDSIYNPKKNSRSFKLELKDLNSRPSSWDLSFEALTRSVTRPISKLVAENDQLKAPEESDEDPNRTSFFSNSPTSSIASPPITPLRSISSPSPMGRGLFDRATDSRQSNRSSRLVDTFTELPLPLKQQSSFIDSATTCKSIRDTQDLQRVFSVMSNDSALTFAASDISSTFSLGNALPMPISHPSTVVRSSEIPSTPLTPATPTALYLHRKSGDDRRSKRFPVLPSINTAL